LVQYSFVAAGLRRPVISDCDVIGLSPEHRMSASSANESLVGELFAAAGGGDWAKVETLITPDFRFIESDSLPVRGTYTGIREYRALFEAVREGAGAIEAEFVAMTSSDTHVVALLVLDFKDHGVRAPLAETFRIRDGRVAEIVPYFFNPKDVEKVFSPVPDIIRAKLRR
jgi:ketosteroid isomerase-like protein